MNNNKNHILNYNTTNSVTFQLANNCNLNLLVDSGASLCVIKYEWLFQYSKLCRQMTYEHITIKGVSGQLQSEGYIFLDLNYEGHTYSQKFYIFKGLSCYVDGILGEIFLAKYGAVIDYDKNTLKLCSTNSNIYIPIHRNVFFL